MKMGPWEDYTIGGHKMFYKCENCKSHSAIMKRRVVEDDDSKDYEFKVCCVNCGCSGSVHRSKALAEKTWHALSDSYYDEMIIKRKKNPYGAGGYRR